MIFDSAGPAFQFKHRCCNLAPEIQRRGRRNVAAAHVNMPSMLTLLHAIRQGTDIRSVSVSLILSLLSLSVSLHSLNCGVPELRANPIVKHPTQVACSASTHCLVNRINLWHKHAFARIDGRSSQRRSSRPSNTRFLRMRTS